MSCQIFSEFLGTSDWGIGCFLSEGPVMLFAVFFALTNNLKYTMTLNALPWQTIIYGWSSANFFFFICLCIRMGLSRFWLNDRSIAKSDWSDSCSNYDNSIFGSFSLLVCTFVDGCRMKSSFSASLALFVHKCWINFIPWAMLVFCRQAGCLFVVFHPLFLIIRVLNIHPLEFLLFLLLLFALFCREHGIILCLVAGLLFLFCL